MSTQSHNGNNKIIYMKKTKNCVIREILTTNDFRIKRSELIHDLHPFEICGMKFISKNQHQMIYI